MRITAAKRNLQKATREMKERLHERVKTTKETNAKTLAMEKEKDRRKADERRKKLNEIKKKTAEIVKQERHNHMKE